MYKLLDECSVLPCRRPIILEYICASLPDYSDFGAYWREEMFDQTPDFEAMCERLWLEVRPLYLQLHAYVRMMLTKKYGVTVVGTSGTIPAHLLGMSLINLP